MVIFSQFRRGSPPNGTQARTFRNPNTIWWYSIFLHIPYKCLKGSFLTLLKPKHGVYLKNVKKRLCTLLYTQEGGEFPVMSFSKHHPTGI